MVSPSCSFPRRFPAGEDTVGGLSTPVIDGPPWIPWAKAGKRTHAVLGNMINPPVWSGVHQILSGLSLADVGMQIPRNMQKPWLEFFSDYSVFGTLKTHHTNLCCKLSTQSQQCRHVMPYEWLLRLKWCVSVFEDESIPRVPFDLWYRGDQRNRKVGRILIQNSQNWRIDSIQHFFDPTDRLLIMLQNTEPLSTKRDIKIFFQQSKLAPRLIFHTNELLNRVNSSICWLVSVLAKV